MQLQVSENVKLTVEFEAESALAGLKSIKYIFIFIFPCLSENICSLAKVGPIKLKIRA